MKESRGEEDKGKKRRGGDWNRTERERHGDYSGFILDNRVRGSFFHINFSQFTELQLK